VEKTDIDLVVYLGTKLHGSSFIFLLVYCSDHSPTMLAGLGTLGLEILEQCDCKLDEVLVPASEKTLLKALRYSIKSIFPNVRIIVSEDL